MTCVPLLVPVILVTGVGFEIRQSTVILSPLRGPFHASLSLTVRNSTREPTGKQSTSLSKHDSYQSKVYRGQVRTPVLYVEPLGDLRTPRPRLATSCNTDTCAGSSNVPVRKFTKLHSYFGRGVRRLPSKKRPAEDNVESHFSPRESGSA